MNQLLEKTKKDMLEKADPRLRAPIMKAVEAGQRIMYAPETRKMVLQEMRQAQDPEAIGAGVAKLVGIMFHKVGGRLPMQVAIPAAVLLLCEALQFLEDAGVLKADAPLLAACTSATGSSILQMFGASPQQLQAFVNKGTKSAAAAPPQPPGLVAGAMGGA